MKIVSAKVFVCSPSRNFVTLKIETEEGIYGIGDATLNGRELAVASYLEEHIVPLLIGKDASRIEDIWQYLYRGVYWRRGSITMTAIAAVDVALWDIKAKKANMPLYQLLGGKSRDSVRVYAHANGTNIDHLIDEVRQAQQLGYSAIRIQSGIPGIKKTYGVTEKGIKYEPANASLPEEQVWSTTKYINHIENVFAAIREEFGYDLDLLHDVHHRLTPNEAAQVGKILEKYRPFWLEDMVPAENQDSFRLIRSRTTAPLAVGEVFNSIWDCKTLIENQLIDYIRTTIVHAGGITHLRRIADLASLYHVRTGFHGATDLSPITMGCALHFDTWVPNFGIQEHMPHEAIVNDVFPNDYHFDNGYMHCGETAGHGVDFNEQLATQYPYKPAYLPVNRLEDGTLWNW
ncbi:D-mannonate dehydratase ManD [Vibrio sp. MEBiC08052]|uniref:D-mannonate dehydratase ManD n=1 Tax=Vibrio sp. MEBiC08052 TaxID=1761910 RepID=UPI0007408972|nr:D-mannonate dehydratase ManD [Vibrio sp. MEBiC08052]KUI97907.1 galactonate dehydratase [Vibrio sp. MEBiC08052]